MTLLHTIRRWCRRREHPEAAGIRGLVAAAERMDEEQIAAIEAGDLELAERLHWRATEVRAELDRIAGRPA